MATVIEPISQTISTIPVLRHRSTVNPTSQADKDDFVIKYEANNDHLANNTVSELNTLKGQVNTTIGQINTAVTTINTQTETAITKANEASESASEAEGYKNQAEAAVASLPIGTLNDSTTSTVTAWSSQKIADELDSKSVVIDTKLNSTNPSITGSITEEVSVCTLDLDPANGTVQTYTATSNPTFIDSLTEGQFITLVYTNGGFTATFPTLTWWNAEPTLGTTDKLVFEKIGGVLYGCQVGTIA